MAGTGAVRRCAGAACAHAPGTLRRRLADDAGGRAGGPGRRGIAGIGGGRAGITAVGRRSRPRRRRTASGSNRQAPQSRCRTGAVRQPPRGGRSGGGREYRKVRPVRCQRWTRRSPPPPCLSLMRRQRATALAMCGCMRAAERNAVANLGECASRRPAQPCQDRGAACALRRPAPLAATTLSLRTLEPAEGEAAARLAGTGPAPARAGERGADERRTCGMPRLATAFAASLPPQLEFSDPAASNAPSGTSGPSPGAALCPLRSAAGPPSPAPQPLSAAGAPVRSACPFAQLEFFDPADAAAPRRRRRPPAAAVVRPTLPPIH